ncbi:hypothetical protein MKX01_037181 [Papaver californicum]|nr:hypothetical protein MKX01_037181 [Papaver californicum]
MGQAETLMWGFLSCICAFWVSAATSNAAETLSLGVNWGGMSSHHMLPSTVVEMIKNNGIKKVKLFESDNWTVKAFAGSDIEVMVAIPNDKLAHFGKYDHAKEWVKQNISQHIMDGGVNIKYVAVGNEPFLSAYNGSNLKTTFPALQNIQKALNEHGFGDKIKASIPQNADVYESSNDTPSEGQFRSDIKDLMHQIVKFLHDNDAPFIVNIYPFLSLYQNPNFPFELAFFDGGGKSINDKGVQYTNVFEANYDTLVWALTKAGAPNLKIVVGEIGWPTDGNKFATVGLAKKFYNGLLKKMASSKKGTPLRPGHLDVYLFSLFDEDQKSIAPGPFERHWGIFRYDGKPKFPMDLTGQGQEKYLIEAKGVQYLTKQWCVFNKEHSNTTDTVPGDLSYACSLGDCTALGYGSSCNHLDSYGNISYAYNMYFQMQDQDVQACDFHGTGMITTVNASTGSCLFPVQIENAGKRVELMSLTSMVLLSFFVGLVLY